MSAPELVALFLGCVVSGVLPWVSAEVMVAAAAVLLGPSGLALVPLVAAAGQMASKTTLYVVVRWMPERLPAKARDRLASASALARSPVATGLTVLASATVGLPPFYLVTLAAGLVRVPLPLFFGVGLLGTALRYAVIAWSALALGGASPL